MPKVSVEIPEVYESISRPVAVEVMRHLFKITGIPQDTRVQYIGKGELSVPKAGTTLDKEPSVRFPSETKFSIDVTEEYWQEAPVNQANLRPEHQVIFADPELDIYIKPVYQITEVSMTVTARFRDKVSAIKWRDGVRKLVSAGRVENLHEISYHFPLPLEFIVILSKLHEMREAVDGYGDAIGDYLKNHLTERFTVLTNQAGNHPTIAVKERQAGVIGWFDFGDQPPDPEKNNEDGTFLASFDYRFLYEKCVACSMQYQLMVHNQLVPADYRDESKPYEIGDRASYKSLTRTLLDKQSETYPRSYEAALGMAIPHFDDWLPNTRMRNTTDLLRIMLQVDIQKPTEIVSLKELGYYEFDADAIAYMEEFPDGLLMQGECIFQCVLYRRWWAKKQDLMTIDSNLVLNSVEPLTVRENWHLIVGLNFDVEMLSKSAKERLRRHGVFARKLFSVLMPGIQDTDYYPPIAADGSLRKKEFDDAIQVISEQKFYQRAPGEYRHRTVGNFVIESKRS